MDERKLCFSLKSTFYLVVSQLLLLAQAQDLGLDSSQDLVFNTSFPATYTIGQLGSVTWSGGNGLPVNVSLNDGNDEDQRICTNALNNSCSWTPSGSLQLNLYALQLSQNGTGNFSEGPVSIQAANAASSTSPSNFSSTSSSAASATSANSRVSATSSTPTSTNTSSSSVASTSNSSLSGGAIAGIVVGAVAVLTFVGLAIWWSKRRSATQAKPTEKPSGWSKAELSGEGTASQEPVNACSQSTKDDIWNNELGGVQRFEIGGHGRVIPKRNGGIERYELPAVGTRS